MVLTDNKRLVRNVCLNLIGAVAPLLVALIAVPKLVEGLGTERFGVLMLAWMTVGYFNVFDLGLGRALTKMVSEKLGAEQYNEIPAVIWTAIILLAGLGVFASILFALCAPRLVSKVLTISSGLQPETLVSFYLLAGTLPFVITTTGLRGVVEAHQRFGLINLVRVPFVVVTFIGPVVMLSYSTNLISIVSVLVVARLCYWCVYVMLCIYVEPTLRYSFGMHRELLMPLLKFGGWLTVVNLIRPLMVYLDRFMIGATISMVAVAYYTTPYEVVTKFWIVPGALMSVMFPAFSAILMQDKGRAARLYDRVVKYVFFALFPFVLITVTFSYEGLYLWLGREFASNSCIVLQLLAVGVFINSHAHVASGMVQSAGRPDIAAKLHIVELPIYLLLLWWMLDNYGIIGAAIVWILRVLFDSIALFVVVHKLLPTVCSFTLRPLSFFCLALFMLILGGIISGIVVKILFLLLVLVCFYMMAWRVGLLANEKELLINNLKKVLPSFKGRPKVSE